MFLYEEPQVTGTIVFAIVPARKPFLISSSVNVSPSNSYQTAGSMVSQWANKPFGQGGITTNTTGAKASVLPNRNLGWEKTASTNFGVDFGFLNNRITGSVEYYIANTSPSFFFIPNYNCKLCFYKCKFRL